MNPFVKKGEIIKPYPVPSSVRIVCARFVDQMLLMSRPTATKVMQFIVWLNQG